MKPLPSPLRLLLPSLLFYSCLVQACGDDHGHVHHQQIVQRAAVTTLRPPTRPLEWLDLNIIHTTDSHGWLRGHKKSSWAEPNYSADYGDFASFVDHMKALALEKDVDLLLVDSGDLHDGTGLTDGFPAGGVDGHDANPILESLPYDVMAIGNHELYVYAVTEDMHTNLAPALDRKGGHYLSSNVNITVSENGVAKSVPVGKRYAKFKTRKGRRVTAFGVLFNFGGNSANTTVQKVEDFVKEAWFIEAIQEEPDFFLLAGHMPVAKDRWPLVFNAIRAVHPDTPIVVLGGHTHVRDCLQYDGRSIGFMSGQYMETVGFMSANLEKTGNITVARRYLDANRVTYEYHTGKKGPAYLTPRGASVKKLIEALAKKFNLDEVYGTAPHDYSIHQAPYPSENSSLSLYAEKAAPLAVSINNTRSTIPSFFIAQSGSQRFNVFKGPFTRNDQFTASPFANGFVYIEGVTLSVAEKLVPVLNGVTGGATKREEVEERERGLYEMGHIDGVYGRYLEEMDKRFGGLRVRDETNLTYGYVTTDACPGIGDDIPHTPLPFYNVPVYISSNPPPNTSDDALVDLVFVDFFMNDLLKALNSIQNQKAYTATDVKQYTSILVKDVYELYAKAAWN